MSRLAYRVDGPAGAPVLLAGPSLGTTTSLWDPQVAVLARDRRLVRFDLPGHGDSPPPEGSPHIGDLGRLALGVLDELGSERADYVGVSLGGMIGLWLAAHAPVRIGRLAIVCSAAYLPPADGWLARAALVREQGMAAVADAVVARWFTPALSDPSVRERFRDMLLGVDPGGYATCCEAIAGMDLRPMLPGITAPTLVVAGREDPAIPLASAELVAQTVPGGRLALLDNAAHLANVERAAQVTALLTGFLEER
jgi:3-oxoadipate enol-lactonase